MKNGFSQILVIILLILVGAGAYFFGRQNIFQKLPTIPTPSTLPTKSPLSNVIGEIVKLKVSAVGGDVTAPPYEFTFSFNKGATDSVQILKRNENEVKFFSDYREGYLDKGFVVENGNIKLTVQPQFEGTGTTLPNKPSVAVISNPNLKEPIFRIKAIEIFGPQNTTDNSIYTTTYSESPENCSAFNQGNETSSTCVWSGTQVFFEKLGYSIFCSSTKEDEVSWCDNIVKSLNVSSKKI